jgi:hypothetical protein
VGDPRAPVIPIGVEVDAENLVITSRGEMRHDYRVILSEEDVGRMKGGYVCAKCMEVQEKPFPKECYLCKFPMADKQAEFLAKAYQGTIRVGPSSSLEDEFAAMDEWEEAQRRNSRDEILRPSQILLPGKDF